MRVLLSTHGSHGSHGDVDPMVGLAVQLRAHGAAMPVCAPPVTGATLPPPLAAEGRDALVPAMPAGGWL